MTRPDQRKLSKRARQVVDTLYRLEEASAAELLEAIPQIPSYSAVRSILRRLVQDGHVGYREKGLRYVYFVKGSRREASRSAMRHLMETFFDGSPEKAMKALIDLSRNSEEEELGLDELEQMIKDAKRRGK